MSQNPIDQLRALRARRRAQQQEAQRTTYVSHDDTQPIPAYRDGGHASPIGAGTPRRRGPRRAPLAALAVAGIAAVGVAYAVPAIAGGGAATTPSSSSTAAAGAGVTSGGSGSGSGSGSSADPGTSDGSAGADADQGGSAARDCAVPAPPAGGAAGAPKPPSGGDAPQPPADDRAEGEGEKL